MQALLELARHSVGRCAHAAVLVDSGGGGDGAPSTVPLRCVASTATAGAGSMMDMVPFLHAGAGMEVELQRALESECDEPLVVLDAAALTGASNASLDYRFVTAVRCCRREDSVAAVAGILCVFDNMPRSASPPEADLDALRLVAGLLAGLVPMHSRRLRPPSRYRCQLPKLPPQPMLCRRLPRCKCWPPCRRIDRRKYLRLFLRRHCRRHRPDCHGGCVRKLGRLRDGRDDQRSRHVARGSYLYASPASKELLGWEPEGSPGSPSYLFHPDEIAPNREILGDILDDVEKGSPLAAVATRSGCARRMAATCGCTSAPSASRTSLFASPGTTVAIRCTYAAYPPRAPSLRLRLDASLTPFPAAVSISTSRPVLSICSSRFNCAKPEARAARHLLP